jgi:hypothetical protein
MRRSLGRYCGTQRGTRLTQCRTTNCALSEGASILRRDSGLIQVNLLDTQCGSCKACRPEANIIRWQGCSAGIWRPAVQLATRDPTGEFRAARHHSGSLINGRDDFNAPAAARERFIELLGTPAANKKLVVLEGGHFPHDIRGLVRHTLDWFDLHLGPVR